MVRTTSTCVQLLVPVCCLILWPLTAEAQMTLWEKYQRAGVQAYKQGSYAEAEQQFTTALEEAERLGLSDQHLTIPLATLALVYSAQNQPDKAEPLYQRLFMLREKTLGPEHLEVAASLDNLAEVYEAQGQYSRAEPFYQRALTIREKTLTPNHPGIATSLDNLAGIYEAQGQHSKAEPLYQQALTMREQTLKPNHPSIATSLNNLAEIYQVQGRYADAEALHKRALALREQVFGPDHPHVITSLNNLALVYTAQGQYDKAEPLYERAVAIDRGQSVIKKLVGVRLLREAVRARGVGKGGATGNVGLEEHVKAAVGTAKNLGASPDLAVRA